MIQMPRISGYSVKLLGNTCLSINLSFTELKCTPSTNLPLVY